MPPAGTGGQSRDRAQTRAVHIPSETPISLFPFRAGSFEPNQPSWAYGRHTEGTMPTSTPHKAFQRGTGPPQHTSSGTVTPQWGQLPFCAPVPTHPTGKRAPCSPRPQQAEPSQQLPCRSPSPAHQERPGPAQPSATPAGAAILGGSPQQRSPPHTTGPCLFTASCRDIQFLQKYASRLHLPSMMA